MTIIGNLLDDIEDVDDPGEVIEEEVQSAANDTITNNHDIDEGNVPPVDPGPEPVELPVNSDPEEESEDQFDILSEEEFETNAVEICIEKEGVDGETDIGVQVTDHHGTFNETPTTSNPGSSFLAPVAIEFEDGTGCFKIGNPGVDGVLFDLLPFGGGLETVDNIENVAIAVDGEEPDALTIQGVDVPQNDTSSSSIGAESVDQPFAEYEADRPDR